jgi:hypothetical protein
MKRAIVVCAGLLALVAPAAAESPVALVEDVQGKVTGAEFMDYVAPKTVIKLAAGRSAASAPPSSAPTKASFSSRTSRPKRPIAIPARRT